MHGNTDADNHAERVTVAYLPQSCLVLYTTAVIAEDPAKNSVLCGFSEP